jgi:phospholipid/cholesterol/gamma-HCH transport system permease protein
VSVTPSVAREVEGDGLVLSLAGDWTVANSAALEATADALAEPAHERAGAILDLSRVDRMDTAGAWAIDRARAELDDAGVRASYRGARPEYAVLLKEAGYQPIEPPKPTHLPTAVSLLSAVGESVYTAGYDLAEGVSFFGQMVAMTIRLLPYPHRWRWTAMTYQLENYSVRSVPIIMLINFLVGAIVMQQGIFQLSQFGASPYAVNLVGVLGMRELALLMTAIMIAGRTGSAITAEIGSMNMREEIDALRVMALDPLEVLIMPRLVALVIALPVLTFLADLAELAGGMLVSFLYAGMTPIVFITRLHNAITTDTFIVGLIKAPFMALTIGIIAGVEGMDVHGSAESLGRNVTASVVKSIFMVIVMDGLFAMFFSAIDY